MYVYRNSNNGDIYETPRRSLRLEALPNWLLLSSPEPPAAPEPEPPAGPQRPLDSDTREVWIKYAIARGMPAKDARALSKAALIKEFGQEDSDG